MAKTSAEYAEILKAAIKIQILYITEDPKYDYDEYLQGQEQGLLIALEKIEASKFLTED